jgi:hypothetical protein
MQKFEFSLSFTRNEAEELEGSYGIGHIALQGI